MTDKKTAHSGHVRLWTVDAVLGVCAAMLAMTVAQAALPTPPVHTRPQALAIAPAPAPEPVVLIAFTEPLPGEDIVSPFGRRQLPWEEHGRLHAGVDIAADAGRPILASADGVVLEVGRDAGYGRYVQVKHAEGLTTLYAHMGHSLPNIAAGVAVKAGTPLGVVGSTGSSTGAHLHFEIRDEKDRPLNPTMFLDHEFSRADELPLRAALRMPRGTRVAYVSRIPASKRGLMSDRPATRAPQRAAEHLAAASAPQSNLGAVAMAVDHVAGRPHAQISAVFSPRDAEPPRIDPPA